MLKQINLNIKDFDWLIFFLSLIISLIGIMEIYSATQHQHSENFHIKQLCFLGLGLVVMFIIANVDYHTFTENAPYIYLGTILALILVLIIAPTVSGTKGWIPIGTFKIQPSEFAKVAVILALSRFLCEIREKFLTFVHIVKASLIVSLPMGLVLVQPDLGSAMTFIPPLIVGLFLGGLRFRWIICGILLSSLITTTGWYNLKEYQKERIYTFLEPENDPQGWGYHSIQSRIAVGSGGVFGKGVTQGSQTTLGFLPEPHTDFIFSVTGEELGFIGSITILGLYFLTIMRAIHVAQTARDKLGIYLTVGCVSVMLFHIFVNVGMVLGLMPITGIPLPLMSYGGSSMLSTFILLGLIINVRMNRFVN